MPPFMMERIESEDLFVQLQVVSWVSLQNMLAGAGIGGLIVWGLNDQVKNIARKNTKPRASTWSQNLDSSANYIRTPNTDIHVTMISPSGTTYKNISSDIVLRLDRKPVSTNIPPKTDIQKLEMALLEILHKHKNTPADPQGHHSDANLYEHSLTVASRLYDACKNHAVRNQGNQTRDILKFARVIGLAHDIGKIIAYTQKDGKWKKRSHIHDKLSTYIVSMLPEYRALSKEDQEFIFTVLNYSHHYKEIPKRRNGAGQLDMIYMLRKTDGLATKDEKYEITRNVNPEEYVELLTDAYDKILPALNVNGHKGGTPEGWNKEIYTYTAILESKLISSLDGMISEEYARGLSLVTKILPYKAHPASKIVFQTLKSMGLILLEYNQITTDDGLFEFHSGNQKFSRVYLFDKDALENRFGIETVQRWGDSVYEMAVKPLPYHQRR